MSIDREWLDTWMSNRIDSYGVSARTLSGSPSAEANEKARFQALADLIPFPKIESVLDVDCGFGRLRDDLRRRGWLGKYVGIEASEPVFSRIPSRNEDTFVHGDIDDAPQTLYDVTIALGIFNHRQAFSDANTGFSETFDRMWQRTRFACVVDFLCPESDFLSNIAIHRSYSDVLGSILSRTRKVALDHTYLPYEYMVVAYKTVKSGEESAR